MLSLLWCREWASHMLCRDKVCRFMTSSNFFTEFLFSGWRYANQQIPIKYQPVYPHHVTTFSFIEGWPACQTCSRFLPRQRPKLRFHRVLIPGLSLCKAGIITTTLWNLCRMINCEIDTTGWRTFLKMQFSFLMKMSHKCKGRSLVLKLLYLDKVLHPKKAAFTCVTWR